MTTLPFPDDDWFENALGFKEVEYNETQQILMEMQKTSSDPSTKFRWQNTGTGEGGTTTTTEVTFGNFQTQSVEELHYKCKALQNLNLDKCTQGGQESVDVATSNNKITWRNIEASVLDLHADPDHAGAVFQAASQFNCLEFTQSTCTPEMGITGYAWDHTQGPACAMACGPGTAFRNYLVPVRDGNQNNNNDNVTTTTTTTTTTIGQRARSQINTLQPILNQLMTLNNGNSTQIKVKNGYANANDKQLLSLHKLIKANEQDLVNLLQVGIQRDTEVTYPTLTGRTVTQVYCSAVPVSYSLASDTAWEPLARVVLKGAYEATLLEGVRKQLSSPSPDEPTKVFLTLVGGGVFGNKLSWIWEAMEHAHAAASLYGVNLDVCIVHYSGIPNGAQSLVDRLEKLNAETEEPK